MKEDCSINYKTAENSIIIYNIIPGSLLQVPKVYLYICIFKL